ncbi:MAG: hypothetical protein RL753_879, partial [Bacteroidota bacterium]
ETVQRRGHCVVEIEEIPGLMHSLAVEETRKALEHREALGP